VTSRATLAAATFLVAALAGAACSDGARPTATVAAADTADQILYGMSYYVTVEGIRRARVQADTAYFYQPTQRAELVGVKVTFFNAAGEPTSTLTSREGTYHWRSGDMEGRGNVRVVTTDGRTLTTEVLRYHQARNEVESDRHFVHTRPDGRLEGDGFRSDPDFRDVVATRVRGEGGAINLPNQ
jgi:LPS export ABC transporter protein LptC